MELDSDGIPEWGSPVEHEDAMKSFCKVVRYWTDHSSMTDIRCKPEQEPIRFQDFIELGMDIMWNFVVKPDEEQTIND
jgi:hypothetical protein